MYKHMVFIFYQQYTCTRLNVHVLPAVNVHQSALIGFLTQYVLLGALAIANTQMNALETQQFTQLKKRED